MRPMLCQTFDGTLPAGNLVVEPKLDGIRVVVEVNRLKGTVAFHTRNGKPIASLAHLADNVRAFAATLPIKDYILWLDGEAVCGDFFDGIGALRSKKPAKSAVIHFFDVITRTMMLDGITQTNRNFILSHGTESARVCIVPSEPFLGVKDALQARFDRAVASGYEGIVIKACGSRYEAGERSPEWIKVKAAETADCRVVFVDGDSLVVDFKGRPVRVGSGLPAKVLEAMRISPSSIVGSTVEVGYHEVTPSGSMRHPAFKRFRCDK
jgi:DNA ligase-1